MSVSALIFERAMHVYDSHLFIISQHPPILNQRKVIVLDESTPTLLAIVIPLDYITDDEVLEEVGLANRGWLLWALLLYTPLNNHRECACIIVVLCKFASLVPHFVISILFCRYLILVDTNYLFIHIYQHTIFCTVQLCGIYRTVLIGEK